MRVFGNYFPFTMPQMVALFIALMVTSSDGNVFEELFGSIVKESTAVIVPVEQTVVAIASEQCEPVKKLIGVNYDRYKDGKEPDLDELALYYITRNVTTVYYLNNASTLITKSSEFDPSKRLKIYIHGFRDNPKEEGYQTMSSAFFSIGDYNILALDSSSLIGWFYLRASTYIRFIGTKLGEVLAAIMESGTSPTAIHLIGHSLGAHISAFAAKKVYELTGHKVARISGLDPAGPCFTNVDPELRLKSDNAVFVDVIHSDAGVFGLEDNVGHVDFRPNGGNQQPECPTDACSHSFSWKIYAESVEFPNDFLAVECNDWNEFRQGQCKNDTKKMGYGCTSDTRGDYYLQTSGKYPYGLGKNGTTFVNNEGIIRSLGIDDLSL